MPPALTERFQVLRGRLAPCGCTWPRWLDGSFGLPFHEIFVALGSSPAREKWPSTAGQRNRSLERQNALHSVRFCITNLLVKPETDPVVNNAMHACFGSEKFQPKKRKLWQNKKTSWKCRNLCISSASFAKRRVSSWRSTGISWTDRSGRQRKVRRSGKLVVCNGNILWMQSQWMAGMGWCLAKLGKSMEVL